MFAGKNKTEEKEAATDANIVPGSARKQQRHPTPGEKSEDRNPAYQQQRVLPLRHYRGIVGWINGGQGKERNNISCPRIMRVFVHVQSFRDLSFHSCFFTVRVEKRKRKGKEYIYKISSNFVRRNANNECSFESNRSTLSLSTPWRVE